MSEHADGTIIIGTEIDTQGAEAGSVKLLNAIRSLTDAIKSLKGVTESLITKLSAIGATTGETLSDGEASAESFNNEVKVLDSTISDLGETAESFEGKAEGLGSTVSDLGENMSGVGVVKIPTQEYQKLNADIEKLERSFDTVFERQQKLQAFDVSEQSKQWQSVEYDLERVSNKLYELKNKKAAMESNGTAFEVDPRPYNALLNNIEGVDNKANRLAETYGKLKATGTAPDSKQWLNLKYNINLALESLKEYKDALATLHSVGAINDDQFNKTSNAISSASDRLNDLNSAVDTAKGTVEKAGNAAKTAGKDLENAGRAAEKSTSGFERLFARMNRLIRFRVISAALRQIISALKEGVNNFYQYSKTINGSFAKTLDNMSTTAQHLRNSIGAAIVPITTALAPVFDFIIDKLLTFINIINQFFAALSGSTTWSRAVKYPKEYAEATNEATAANEDLKSSIFGFDEINKISKPVVDATESDNYSSMFEDVAIDEKIARIANKIKPIFDWIKEHLDTILETVGLIGIGFLSWKIGSKLLSGIDLLKTALGTGLIIGGVTLVIDNIDSIKNGEYEMASLEGLSKTLISGIAAGLGLVALGAGAWAIPIAAAVAVLATGILTDWSGYEEDIETIRNWLYEKLEACGMDCSDGLLSGYLDGLKTIGTWLKENVLDPIVNWIKNLFGIHSPSTVMAEIGSYIALGLLSGIKNTWGGIKNFFSSAINGIRNLFSGINWGSIGSNICIGIANGISNAWDSIENAAKSVGSWCVDTFKDLFGIHSPSKLFHDVIGLNIGYGVANGISDSKSEILRAVSGITESITSEIEAEEYSLGNISVSKGIDTPLRSFSDRVCDSFSNLVYRLQAIADRVTFAEPVVCYSAVPYASKLPQRGITLQTDYDDFANDIKSAVIDGMMQIHSTMGSASSGDGDTQVNVYIGNKRIEDIITEVNKKKLVRSGGRA